jgi:hypothetical protein
MTWGFVTCGPNEALVVSGNQLFLMSNSQLLIVVLGNQLFLMYNRAAVRGLRYQLFLMYNRAAVRGLR